MIKFLVIRFSSIGDIVLTSPVMRCLKQQGEDAEVHFLTKKQFAGIAQNNPNIDKVHVFDGDLGKTIKELKAEEFDYIIDLHHNLRTAIVKRKLRLLAFSFNKLNFEKWLLVTFKIDRMPKVHIVDRYMETIKPFIDRNDNKGLDYFIPKKDEVKISEFFPEIAEGTKFVALVTGAKHATKQMPVAKMIDLCKQINYPVVLLGGPEDKTAADEILRNCGKNVFSAVGKSNLNQSASIIRQAEVVLSHDTGLMHIAAAFHKKIVSVWGNTVPELGMYPYLPHPESVIFETKGLKCRPCSKIGYAKCPKGHFNCMNQIENKEIVAKINSLMD
jgi:ADP-heptose:LPS heptosyltransferase